MYIDYFDSFIGSLKISADNRFLYKIELVEKKEQIKPNEITEITKLWFNNYFKKQQPQWLPHLKPFKTSYTQKVIDTVLNIPFGKCLSYSEVAKMVKSPYSYRAVAMTMKRNPYMIIVPCHRVVAKETIGGYNGGIEIKRKLLEFEKCESINL